MAEQFGHQRLAETHHFTFAFTFRVEVTPALTTAHRQRGEGIFKGLLEAEEFQDRQVYGRVETHTAFVRTNGRAKLYAPRAVDLHLIAIVQPNYAELDHALRFNQTFQQRHLTITRVLLKKGPQRRHYLTNGLRELGLIRVALLHMVEK